MDKEDLLKMSADNMSNLNKRKSVRLVSLPALDKKTMPYEKIGAFCCGLAHVYYNNEYGFINKEGRLVTSIDFDGFWPSNFANGFAKVEIDEKLGMIDTSGSVVIPIQYKEIWRGSDNLVTLKDFDNKYFVFDLNSGKIISLHQYWKVGMFKNGYTDVAYGKFKGIIDKDLNIIHLGLYKDFHLYDCRCAKVRDMNGNSYYIDLFGKKLSLENIVDDCYDVYNGFTIIESKGKFGVIDKDFNIVVEPKYIKIKKNYKIDENVLSFEPFARFDGKYWHIFDKDSNELFKLEGDDKLSFVSDGEFIVVGDLGSGFYAINLKGERLFNCDVYEEIEILGQGLFEVRKNKMWGVIDSDGEILLPIEYDDYSGISYSGKIFGLLKSGEYHFFEIVEE